MVRSRSVSLVSSHGDRSSGVLSGSSKDDVLALPLSTSILIVEDSAMIAWMLESFLDEMGFSNITMSSTGEDAVAIARHSPPGLIVSDIQLGDGVDGVDAAITICRARGVPVLFVTAHADDAMRRRISSHLPMARLICKPVQREPFQAAIRRLLARPNPG